MKPSFEGHHCQTCGQYVKLYKRPISSTETCRLIKLYNLDAAYPDRTWFHLNDIVLPNDTSAGDFAKLRYWGLIEEKPPTDGQPGRTSGSWGMTDKGRLFVEGRMSVPKYVWLFNSTVYGFSGDEQFIKDRLGKKFKYDQLMAGVAE